MFGAIFGAIQRATEMNDRMMQTLLAAGILGVVFASFSLGGGVMGPSTYC